MSGPDRDERPLTDSSTVGTPAPAPAPTPTPTPTPAPVPAPTPVDDLPEAAPTSLRELFVAFTWLSLQGFGGVLPVAQRELVERRRWITRHQFVEMLAISQVLPGPNVVNLSLMFGDRCFGTRGALTALAGMLAVPMVIVLGLAALYAGFDRWPAVSGALRGMGAVAAGLVISTALKLSTTLGRNPLGWPLALALAASTALATGWFKLPLLWVLLALGAIGCGVAWRRLGGR